MSKSEVSRQVHAQRTSEEKKVWAEKVGLGLKKFHVEHPEARKKISQMQKRAWKRSGYKTRFVMTPEIARKIGEAQKGRVPHFSMLDEKAKDEFRKNISRKSKRRFDKLGKKHHELFQPEIREKCLKNAIEAVKESPLTGKFETNLRAREWTLMDPSMRMWRFKNLAHFVRNHKHLFTEEQLQVTGNRKNRDYTRAYAGLAGLSLRCKKPANSWFGWTNQEKPTS